MTKYFGHEIPVILVGCKADKRHDSNRIQELKKTNDRPIALEEVRSLRLVFLATLLQFLFQGIFLQNSIGAREYFECSAKTRDGVQDVFEAAARAALLVKSKKRRFRGGCVVL